MATTATELRRELLIGIRDYEDQMEALIATYNSDLERASLFNANNFDRFEIVAAGIIAAFLVDFARISVSANTTIATQYATYVMNSTGVRLSRAGAVQSYSALNRLSISVPQAVSDSFLTRRNIYDGRTFTGRLKTLQAGSERIVRGLISEGVASGRSVNDVARSIQHYIDPSSQAGRRFTRGNGINYTAIQKGKRLPKGSIRYNAVRIARSEIMRTYDLASNAFYKDKPYARGWTWNLSNTHRGYDGCDILSQNSPHDKLPARPHPQCTCDPRPVVITVADLRNLVNSGLIA